MYIECDIHSNGSPANIMYTDLHKLYGLLSIRMMSNISTIGKTIVVAIQVYTQLNEIAYNASIRFCKYTMCTEHSVLAKVDIISIKIHANVASHEGIDKQEKRQDNY